MNDLPKAGKAIDIWWSGRETNGDLMLLLAYLLKLDRTWEKAKIRILSAVDNEESKNY